MGSEETRGGPGPYTHHTLIALGAAQLGWSAWLWLKLIGSRSGDSAGCAIGGGQGCASVWESSFADAVHELTRVPVAGWGVIWAAVAVALAVGTRALATPRAWWDAVAIHSVLGLGGVGVLAAVMYLHGSFCSDCAIAYGLTVAYAWVALRRAAPIGRQHAPAALGRVALATAAAWLLALYPASRTPGSAGTEALDALRALEVPEDGPEAEKQLAGLLKSLDAGELQSLADMLATWRAAREVPLRPARALIGRRNAPVRLTEFADALCGHCAQLHELLSGLRRQLPPGSFSIEARHFPLDAACNPQMSGPSKHPVRCTAARVLICAEHQPWAFELAGEIFEHQRELDEARLWELVERHGARAAIESCAFSEVTEARLLDDIAWAVEQGIEGTPLVLIDGRRAPSHPTFLIAMILAGSDPDHPLLRRLPPGHALAP